MMYASKFFSLNSSNSRRRVVGSSSVRMIFLSAVISLIQSVLDDATSNQNPTATLPTVLECTWLGRLMAISRPCLNCRNLTTNATRCTRCQTIWYQQHPKPDRPHYKGDYRKRAKQIRDNAIACWICGEGKRPNDPFTADHLIPADPNSPLAAAHRSCNSRRQNKPFI